MSEPTIGQHGRFSGAVAVVTGAGHGIGAACAARLAAEGAVVTALDLDGDAVRERATSWTGGGHVGLAVDVTDGDAVAAAIAAVGERHGRIDTLVNVAGGGEHEPRFEEGDDAVFERMWRLNFLSVVSASRASLPLLQASDRAAVVTVSSVNGLMTLGTEAYSSAKGALVSLTQNLAVRYAPRVRFNTVAPGTIRTRVWDHQGGPDRLAVNYPMGRVGEPEDIAAAVAFLGSGEAAWITGQTLAVDGGLTVSGVHAFGRRD